MQGRITHIDLAFLGALGVLAVHFCLAVLCDFSHTV